MLQFASLGATPATSRMPDRFTTQRVAVRSSRTFMSAHLAGGAALFGAIAYSLASWTGRFMWVALAGALLTSFVVEPLAARRVR